MSVMWVAAQITVRFKILSDSLQRHWFFRLSHVVNTWIEARSGFIYRTRVWLNCMALNTSVTNTSCRLDTGHMFCGVEHWQVLWLFFYIVFVHWHIIKIHISSQQARLQILTYLKRLHIVTYMSGSHLRFRSLEPAKLVTTFCNHFATMWCTTASLKYKPIDLLRLASSSVFEFRPTWPFGCSLITL